jgi:hypothetical protein
MEGQEQKAEPAADQTVQATPPNHPPSIPSLASHSTLSEEDRIAKEMSQAERVMARWARITAFGTLVSAAAICLQWYEMHTGGEDTKAIAEAAKQQACSARQIAEASKRNATAAEGFTADAGLINDGIRNAVLNLGAQAASTSKVAGASQTQAGASEQLATTTAKQLEVSQRPWIRVNLQLAGPVGLFTPPPTEAKPISISVPLRIVAVNIGAQPAILVRHSVRLMLQNDLPGDNDVEELQKKMCDDIPRVINSADAIFPNDVYQPSETLYLSQPPATSGPDPLMKSYTMPNGEQIVELTDKDDVGPSFLDNVGKRRIATQVLIIGCLDYTVAYSNIRHQTMFLYGLENFSFANPNHRDNISLAKPYGVGNSAN